MKKIAILGSTGSIGTQALDVIERDSGLQVVGLTTNTQIDLLEKQIIKFRPKLVAVMDKDKAKILQDKIRHLDIEVVSGLEGLIQVGAHTGADLLITAVVGMVGLLPTIEAIKNNIDIALANKETLVVAGEIVMNLAKEKGVSILPVDSEHSAIFQCLLAGKQAEVSRLILTASGGPFRTCTKEQLEHVTLEQALKHPNWSMGSKITIDSATLMNKGLEVIEASHLFNMSVDKIDVVVHKESIIHSMVEYVDGSTIAQLGMPDMRHPIDYAIHYPNRADAPYIPKLDLVKIGSLNFEAPKKEMFPCLTFAYDAIAEGGTKPAVLNAANEVAVAKFLNKEISFVQIPKLIHKVMEKHICIFRPSLEQIIEADEWTRKYCREEARV
ncbi:MAG: 1-deoxy-D-xylulose-5-phosphate reductoisomerase [Epulopiscium sp. Nele67-Bin004]|nr:MAG: 1-deoxy-D-xylulose-5-phosphate reductoisomerase [Epulopiscium sp. Nele67-Bin004]